LNLADKVVLFRRAQDGAPLPSTGRWPSRRPPLDGEGRGGRGGEGRGGEEEVRPPVLQLPRLRTPDGAAAQKAVRPRSRARAGNEKSRLGGYPGRSSNRLLTKETVRETLGGSLLLGIHARIERGRRKQRGDATEDGRAHARAIGPMPLARAPRTARRRRAPRSTTELSTEHGQARLRLRFHRDVLKGEDHGTVAASLSGCGLQWFRLLRVDAPDRTGIQLMARDSGSRKNLIQ